MPVKRIARIYFVCLLLFSARAEGQVSQYVYGIYDSLGTFYFSKIHLVTGVLTKMQVAGNSIGSSYSSDINIQTSEYYLCEGRVLLTFDAVSGNLVSTDSIPIPFPACFLHIRYNPCDSFIYGIVNYVTSYVFARFHLGTGILDTISTFGPSSFAFGNASILDPQNGIYAFYNGNINGFDLNTGQQVYSTPIINLPNEVFGHIGLNCQTHEIFGTSANMSAGLKYLSTIDPLTGYVSHVGHNGWNIGIMKPAGGGQCYDQDNSIYYYSGAGYIIGASSATGMMVFNAPVVPGAMNYVQHFSGCACLATGSSMIPVDRTQISLGPSLFDERIMLSAAEGQTYEVSLFDLASRIVFRDKLRNQDSFSTSGLESGLYIFKIMDAAGEVFSGKLIKEN